MTLKKTSTPKISDNQQDMKELASLVLRFGLPDEWRARLIVTAQALPERGLLLVQVRAQQYVGPQKGARATSMGSVQPSNGTDCACQSVIALGRELNKFVLTLSLSPSSVQDPSAGRIRIMQVRPLAAPPESWLPEEACARAVV
ncbi:hypothetical protein M8818_000662 [Zalaria obscura]|uniref:Uncharacterized protein n=1 Tax=Zalaria obscura TaxID=2024903 RepID=A0ACC3SMU7_9PEZI